MFGISSSFVIAIILITVMIVRAVQKSRAIRKPGRLTPRADQPVPMASTQNAAPGGNFCVHCGAPTLPEARVCAQCGLKLPEKMA